MNLVQQNERERALKRWQLEHQGTRIRRLADWISTRPDGPVTLKVGRILGEIVPAYLADCDSEGVTP